MEMALQALLIFAVAMVKFAFAQGMATGLGFGFLATWSISTAGGCTGVFLFFHAGAWLMERARRTKLRRQAEGRTSKRAFSRTNRAIIRVKRSQGLTGLAFLTPTLISIPIGSLLAAKYFRHDRRTLPIMLSSVAIWGLVFTAFWQLFR